MCYTVLNLFQSFVCMIQMLVRIIMTIALMLENIIRMFIQTTYNIISFFVQILSLVPICLVFIVTSKMKCAMCSGGGGGCGRGGLPCDCLMSFLSVLILILVCRATGVLDTIFYRLGYEKSETTRHGTVTACSRNDTENYDDDNIDITTLKKNRLLRLRTTNKVETEEEDYGGTIINESGQLESRKTYKIETEEQDYGSMIVNDGKQLKLRKTEKIETEVQDHGGAIINESGQLKSRKTHKVETEEQDYGGTIIINEDEQLRSKKTHKLETVEQDLETMEQADNKQLTTLMSTTVTTTTVTTNAPPLKKSQSVRKLDKDFLTVEYLIIYSTTKQDVLSPKDWSPVTSDTEWTTSLYYLVA